MEVLQLDELLNLKEYLMTLTDPKKYSANIDYNNGSIDAYKHIIEAIDLRIKIIENRNS